MKRESYTYSVVLTPAEEGGFTVNVPALPGCHTEGDSYEEAMTNAREAIELSLQVMLERGEEIPYEPTPSMISAITTFAAPQYA